MPAPPSQGGWVDRKHTSVAMAAVCSADVRWDGKTFVDHAVGRERWSLFVVRDAVVLHE